MMKQEGMFLCPLFSGSSGNATAVGLGEGRLLVDAGKPCKALSQALLQAGIQPETIQARIGKDVERGVRSWDVWERSQQRLPLYSALKTEKVWTDGLSPEEAAEAILKQTCGRIFP